MAVDPSTAPTKDDTSASSPAPAKTPSVNNPKDEIRAVARKFADDPIQNPDPTVWAVLTAISANARRRPQGMNILLSADEHCLGRSVEDTRYHIGSIAVSANHCKILRERMVVTDGCSIQAFLKDTSTNGTYLNWERLRKNNPKAKLRHGDIISFVAPPHDDKSYAFVYREVRISVNLANGTATKRKSEEYCTESKRLKGIGIGAPEGPVSLDDVRSLQRSNTELRQQLESYVLTIETLQSESRGCISRHENELNELKETISSSYIDQIKEFQQTLDVKQTELDALSTLSVELQSSIKDLNERLGASMQSRVDADEIINSQRATISDLETQLTEERNQRRGEREKAEADLKSALQRAHSEAQAEKERQTDVYLRQHKEQQEVIGKLQETEKESRMLVEALRSKLIHRENECRDRIIVEDARESLVLSDKKVRQLEVQLQDEQTASANSRKKSETLESELRRLRKELESEKLAREEAWAKVSALELEIAAAIRDLSTEKQRFQGARERIILRETQLRAFYSTTEEISSLFAKQQEQLKSMQKTLEDEDNYQNTSFDIDLNKQATEKANMVYVRSREAANLSNNTRETSGTSTPKNIQAVDISSSSGGGGGDEDDDDDVSATEKHECDRRSQDGNTQELECTSADRLIKRFVSDIDAVGTEVIPDGEPTDTERVPGTESPVGGPGSSERNTMLHKCSGQAGETMQLDVETQAEDNLEPIEKPEDKSGHCSPSRMEDTETGTIRTADLLASEVAGSWAVSTAPSVHGENESPRSMEEDAAAANEDAAAAGLMLCCQAEGNADGSQTNAAYGTSKMREEHHALNAMIDIVAPEFRQQFQCGTGNERRGGNGESVSDAETEDGCDPSDASHDEAGEDETDEDGMEGGNDAVIEDSVG